MSKIANAANLDSFEKEQLLNFFGHFLSMELRTKLMREMPQIYNKWTGHEVVKVVRASGEDEGALIYDQYEIERESESRETA